MTVEEFREKLAQFVEQAKTANVPLEDIISELEDIKTDIEDEMGVDEEEKEE